MAKTYEAMMKAEEEAQKKKSIPSPSLSPSSSSVGSSPSSHELNSHGLPSVDRGLPSAPGRGPWTVDRGLFLDEYYHLRLNILRSSQNGKIKSLLFLSPTGGEGSTTVLVEFAAALAGQGEKVLLIDANFRSPSLHQQFHLEAENGLTEFLLGKAKLSEVTKKTTVSNLWVIPSGSTPSSAITLNALDPHLQKMKEEMDWVLFDGPPVNHFDEGLALSGKVDGVVMVLQAEKTRWEVAQAAKQRLEDSGGKILGVVLNKRRFYIPKWIYKTL